MSNKPWGSGERFEIFFRYYNTSIQGIPVWKEQVEPKLQKEEPDEGVAGGGHHLPGLHLSRRGEYRGPGGVVLQGHGSPWWRR